MEKQVGIYVRLSQEDSKSGESISIQNQKLMLLNFAKEKLWQIKEIYIDDGFSGTNQNRPALKRMLEDIKQGWINTVLIKDMSRLGRNYLEVGNLAEVFLPEHNCELISLNEPIDEMLPFRNWFNEQHSKTTSQKVRSAKRVSAENGKYVAPFAPYGYKKDPKNKHKLIIDEAVADVVYSIFEMRAAKMGFLLIASKLNEQGIKPPKEYYYQTIGQKNPSKTSQLWTHSTIRGILSNEVYAGHMVQSKYFKPSYKSPKITKKPKEDWAKIENQHPAIVDEQLWQKAQSASSQKYKSRRKNDGKLNLFAGLLWCGICGSGMRAVTEKGTKKDGSEYKYISYICGNYAKSGKSACCANTIGEKNLIEIIVKNLRQQSPPNLDYITNSASQSQENKAFSLKANHQNTLEIHKKQIAKLDLLIQSLYEDKVAKIIPEALFIRLLEKYEQDRQQVTEIISSLENKTKNIKKEPSNLKEIAKKYIEFEILDSEILSLLIDKIIIGKTVSDGGLKRREVKITFFIGVNY